METGNAAAKMDNLLVALALICCGIAFLTSRQKFAAGREAQIKAGKLSPAEAAKNARLIWVCGCLVTALGTLLLIVEIVEFTSA